MLDLSDLGTSEDGFQNTLSDGWLEAFRYDGKLYGVPVDAVSVYLYNNV